MNGWATSAKRVLWLRVCSMAVETVNGVPIQLATGLGTSPNPHEL